MEAVAEIRAFNRFYTQLVGALDRRFLGSEVALPEARLLFEIAQGPAPLARALQARLGLDAGYLSRLLRQLEARGWIARGSDPDDARRRPIALTEAGRAAFDRIDARQRDAVERLLAAVPAPERPLLVAALAQARVLLGDGRGPVTIRPFRAGDMGTIAARQAILYDEGYGWGRPMEVLLGEVTTAFLRDFKPDREQCWVAEAAGRMAGSVFLVDGGGGEGSAPGEEGTGAGEARLRLLYVEPSMRGQGVGAALVAACVGMARAAGYRRIGLWTHTILTSARRIYAAAGFRLVSTAVHDHFGEPMQGEEWRLDLAGAGAPG